MIISKTPFRISFFGGGTDYPDWYRKEKKIGKVLSTAIDKYSYIVCRYLPPFFNYKYRIRYYQREETNLINQIKHPTVREGLKYLKIKEGIEIVHHADLPARSGLGSSSTFTVGLLKALHELQKKKITKNILANQAIHIEQNIVKEIVGSQDQVIAAYGGMNKIIFSKKKILSDFSVKKINPYNNKLKVLEDNLMLFFTGLVRTAADIAKEQVSQIQKNVNSLKEMSSMVDEGVSILENNNIPIKNFGKLLDAQWKLKKSLAKNITNSKIDSIYRMGIEAGALGGKLLGAGSGGFLLFYVEKKNQNNIKKKLKKLLHVPFKFEEKGSHIIYNELN